MKKRLDQTNWRTDKFISINEAAVKSDQWRKEEKKIVTVNGSFDILHVGHLDQLEEAKKQGDVLVVGLNSDNSITGYKGSDRPFFPEAARAAMLAALVCVDFIIIIDAEADDLPKILLRTIKPAVHANGAEYGEPQDWVEWPVMQEVGVQGYAMQKRNDFSTTSLIEQIRQTGP